MVGRPSRRRASKTSPSAFWTSKSSWIRDEVGMKLIPMRGQGSAAMRVGLALGLLESSAYAFVAGGVLAASLVTECAALDLSAASDALHDSLGLALHHCSPASRITSFCSSRPTSRPSEVVTGELSTLCSAMNFAISLMVA